MIRAEKPMNPAHLFRAGSALVLRFWRMNGADRWLTIEAASLLALARGMTLVVPFRHIANLASMPVRNRAMDGESRAIVIDRVRQAIGRCAPRAPWRALCFEQGLTAQWMLRRRGIDTVLYYGAAAKGANGLSAHVWVRDGTMDVIGCETAANYAVLAAFPPTRAT